MNRRTFVTAASVSLALTGHQAFAQRSTTTSSVLTSELTGGQVDVSGTSLPMVNQHIEQADGSEHFHFQVDESGQFDIIFWPQTSGEILNYVDAQVGGWLAPFGGDVLATDGYADGGWIIFDIGNKGKIAYYEYQLGAYPGHDLAILFASDGATFDSNFQQAQAVMIDSIQPFLFLAESDAQAVAQTRIAQTAPATTGSTSTTGTTRTTRSSSSTTSNESETSSQVNTGTSPAIDPVDAVIEHRDEFLTTYDEFYALLELVAAETTTEVDGTLYLAQMVTLAQGWQQYPTQAAQIRFGPSYAELESVYLVWADLVAEFGYAFEDFTMGVATVDDFVAVYEEWLLVDADLGDLLDSAGFFFTRSAKRPAAVTKLMNSARFVA